MADLRDTLRTPGALRLGLGCGTLGSNMSYRAGCALVEQAYDCGFRYFDVAPPYGDGFAERILGDVLSPVRATVTITTKAGRPRPGRVSGFRAVRRHLLPLKRSLPAVWGRLAGLRARDAAAPRGYFAANDVVASIEESLRRLRTEYVDFLLLHEVQPGDVTQELLEALARLRAEARLLGIGLGTSVESSAQLLNERPDFFDMVQVTQYWGAFRPSLAEDHLLLTHGCIGSGMQLIESPEFRRVSAADVSLAEMSRVLTNPRQAPDLLLAAGLQANRSGMVLVASSRPERLRHLVGVATSSELDALAAQLNGCLRQLSNTMRVPGHD